MNSSFLISGPSGQLEVSIDTPIHSKVAVICHPHPLHGGTMNNKVVTTVAKALQKVGLTTVRFNFRGVGNSEGHYDEGRGELHDLLAVLNWIKETYSPTDYWLAGFSFGSHIAFQACLQWPCKQLITIAPPITRFDFSQTQLIHCPWLLIQGDQDEIVDPHAVFASAVEFGKRSVPIDVICIPGAGHFFHGKLIELKENIIHHYHDHL